MTNVKIKIIDGVKYTLGSFGSWCSYNEHKQHHSFNDKPAVIYSDGTKEWWVNGRRQLNKYYVCVYIKRNKQFKEFFKTESQAKQYESDMLSNNLCAWVIENV